MKPFFVTSWSSSVDGPRSISRTPRSSPAMGFLLMMVSPSNRRIRGEAFSSTIRSFPNRSRMSSSASFRARSLVPAEMYRASTIKSGLFTMACHSGRSCWTRASSRSWAPVSTFTDPFWASLSRLVSNTVRVVTPRSRNSLNTCSLGTPSSWAMRTRLLYSMTVSMVLLARSTWIRCQFRHREAASPRPTRARNSF